MTEVAYRVCDKTGLNKDLMHLIEMTVWGTHKYFLMHPELVDYGIAMPYVFRFIPQRERIKKQIKDGKRRPTVTTNKFVNETTNDPEEGNRST